MVLGETDLLLSCPFCRVSFFLYASGGLKCYLPAPNPDQPNLFYAPYWRFKGVMSSCLPFRIDNKLVDATIRAVHLDGLPTSLGLRPQVMTLKYLFPDVGGRFLKPDLPPDSSLAHIRDRFQRIDDFDDDQPLYHRSFFGERISLIYAPFYLDQNRIKDALTGRSIGQPLADGSPPLAFDPQPIWDIKFIPAICPDCGWDLAGDRNTLVLVCTACHAAWGASAHGLQRVDYGVVPSPRPPAIYLPFWRMTANVAGLKLETYADLVRTANLPKAIRPEWENLPLNFWAPAFRAPPQLFLRLSRNITVGPPAEESDTTRPDVPLAGITLSIEEASQSIKTSLANLSTAKRRLFPLLPDVAIRLIQAKLVYLPFFSEAHEFVNPQFQVSVGRNVIQAAATSGREA